MHIQADLEYDFIGEDPSKDFFCPVSLELLLHLPQLTECCGHHLSHPVVERLKRDHKPCLLCNEPNLVTHNDKYFERKVRELRVRCPYIKGCTMSHTHLLVPSNPGYASTANLHLRSRWELASMHLPVSKDQNHALTNVR